MRKRVICGSICIAILTGLLLFTLIGLQPLINQTILDGVILAPQTYDLWGANPGSSNTVALRNYTFFNLTNPRGYLYRGETPIFNQMTNFAYQQRSNFTNYTYSADKSIINFNFWLYFTVLQSSRNVNETVNVINLGPLGFWNQLDTVHVSALAIQGFGGLFVEMNNTIKIQALGQGVAGQYIPQQANWTLYCTIIQLESSLCSWLWNDPFYGISDQNHYGPWIEWLYQDDIDSGMALVQHFSLNQVHIHTLKKLFKPWCEAINIILDDWYCSGQPCQNYDLTLGQLGGSALTANPPTGDPMDSICMSGNITCQGYPQLYSFYKYVFLNTTDQTQFKNLSFSTYTLSQLFSPYNGTLLNVGNLTELFDLGNQFDQHPRNQTLLNKIIAVTHAESQYHAIVIWQYLKYFTYQFVLKTKQKGTRKHAGLAGVFTQAIYQSIQQFTDWLIPQYLSLLVAEQIPNCTEFLTNNIQGIDPITTNTVCQNLSAKNYQNYYQLIQPCLNPILRQTFKRKHLLTSLVMTQFCDPQSPSISTVLSKAHETIYSHYNCTANLHRKQCTPFQLGAKQFLNSSITLHPLNLQIKQYSPSLTGKQWNKELQEFQYRNYLNQAFGNPFIDTQTFPDSSRVASILSFDKFYSVPKMQDLLLEQNQTRFQQLYYWNNASLLLGYIRFLTIEVGFGGFTQQRSANQLLFGYEDQFLKQLKEMDTMMGGDPSIQPIILVNQPNSTLKQAQFKPQSMYTGYSDPLLTRNYVTNMGYQYVTSNKTYYTGYEVKSQQVNPFKHPLILHGTDAFQNLPMSTAQDKQYIYIDTLYRVADMDYHSDAERFEFDLLKYKLSKTTMASSKDYPPNDDFYQPFKGLMNLSFLGLPLFASKNHMLGADDFWLERIEMYDETGSHKQQPNEWDQSFLITQPKSGVTFEALLYLQTNVYLPPDLLFPVQPVMMPLFTIYRGANLTQDAANDILGDLKTALAAPRKLILFCIFGILFIIACITCCLISQYNAKERSESLLESTENALKTEQHQSIQQMPSE